MIDPSRTICFSLLFFIHTPIDRPNSSTPAATSATASATASASADTKPKEDVASTVATPIQSTTVAPETTLQLSALPKSNTDPIPAAPKSAWGPPKTNTPQEPTVQKLNPSVTPAVPKPAWGPPTTNVHESSTTPKPPTSAAQTSCPVVQSTTAKFAWGSSTSTTTGPVASVTPKPANPSASSCRSERAASAFPMTDEIRRNLSTNSRDTENKEGGRARSAFSTRGRRTIRSAIPDSAVLFPVPRPDEGGSRGKSITIYANHFPVLIPNHTINQYDIEISMLNDDGKLFPARKDERWEIMQRISSEIKGFPLVWYDEGKTLYSLELLPDITKPIQIRMKRNDVVKTFQLEIKNLVRQEKLDNIQEFVQKKLRNRPRESVRIIETLLKQTARNDLVAVRNQFYNRNQILADLSEFFFFLSCSS